MQPKIPAAAHLSPLSSEFYTACSLIRNWRAYGSAHDFRHRLFTAYARSGIPAISAGALPPKKLAGRSRTRADAVRKKFYTARSCSYAEPV